MKLPSSIVPNSKFRDEIILHKQYDSDMDKEVKFDAMDSGWRIEGREVARK